MDNDNQDTNMNDAAPEEKKILEMNEEGTDEEKKEEETEDNTDSTV